MDSNTTNRVPCERNDPAKVGEGDFVHSHPGGVYTDDPIIVLRGGPWLCSVCREGR